MTGVKPLPFASALTHNATVPSNCYPTLFRTFLDSPKAASESSEKLRKHVKWQLLGIVPCLAQCNIHSQDPSSSAAGQMCQSFVSACLQMMSSTAAAVLARRWQIGRDCGSLAWRRRSGRALFISGDLRSGFIDGDRADTEAPVADSGDTEEAGASFGTYPSLHTDSYGFILYWEGKKYVPTV